MRYRGVHKEVREHLPPVEIGVFYIVESRLVLQHRYKMCQEEEEYIGNDQVSDRLSYIHHDLSEGLVGAFCLIFVNS